jgi:putative DNA primase/helicase
MRDDLERVVYATISYAPKDWYLNAWESYNWGDDGREWVGGSSPTPGYGEITAYAPFADIDLTDDVKEQRPAGDIPRGRVEDALARYIDAFAELAGDREHVFALDSVGGAYVMVAPTSTAPIAERYAPDGRRRLFDDLTDRMNDWLDDVRADVNDAVDVAGTFEPDLLNNKNRLYKAPMSVHSSLDGVVTPVDVDAPTYEYTPLARAGDAEREAAVEWADGFTADHSEAIESVVSSLWPGYYADAEGWEDALDTRLNDLRTDEREHKREQERLDDVDVPDDLERTDDIDKIHAAIEDINVADLARKVSASWDTAPGRTPKRFEPSWRSSSSGTSCYADREKFVDLKEGKKGGGAVKLVARDRGIITDCRRSSPSGEKFWKAVGALREEGYDIPRFTGGRGVHPDSIGLHESAGNDDEKRRKALRVLKASKKD